MSPRARTGMVVSVAGSLAVGWGLRHLLLIGDCGGPGLPDCPAGATPYFLAVTIGLAAAIIGGIVTRSPATFLVFPAVGAGALWAAVDLTGPARTTALILGGVFLGLVLLPLGVVVRARQKAKVAVNLITSGRAAIGTITDIEDTGITVNRNPQVTMTFRIEPDDGSTPFEGRKTTVISRVDLPRRGQRHPVWYDPADRTKFVVVTKVEPSAPAHVRRMFDKVAATAPASPDAPVDGPADGPVAGDPLDRLAKLNELRLAGALTDEEFDAEKAKLLGST
jgi:hypothetical protein